jgi:NTP pyrophosphatase (non-canonical NTP hydrolase)
MINDLNILEELTLQWAKDRGILQNSTPQIQGLKLVSEMGELADNLAKGRDIKDDIGDCLVVLTNIANMSGTNLGECFAVAYEDIKDRKGFLNSDGIFIKEGDV